MGGFAASGRLGGRLRRAQFLPTLAAELFARRICAATIVAVLRQKSSPIGLGHISSVTKFTKVCQ